jgi:hypothetical protein
LAVIKPPIFSLHFEQRVKVLKTVKGSKKNTIPERTKYLLLVIKPKTIKTTPPRVKIVTTLYVRLIFSRNVKLSSFTNLNTSPGWTRTEFWAKNKGGSLIESFFLLFDWNPLFFGDVFNEILAGDRQAVPGKAGDVSAKGQIHPALKLK